MIINNAEGIEDMCKERIVGIFFDGKNLNGLDLRGCLTINPGLGGSAYDLLTTGEMLAGISGFKVFFYTVENQCLPEKIIQRGVKDEIEAIKAAKADNVDVYIYNVSMKLRENFYETLNKLQISAIAWAHNYLDYRIIKAIRKCDAVKRIVFVGQQHYDAYVDDPILEKATFIYLIVPRNDCTKRKLGEEKVVTYVGSLIKAKGFYILAKNWKYILSEIPEAVLYVIGSGKLYDRTQKLGTYGIAESKYECLFMKYLLDKNGNLMDSVRFMGILGREKENIYEKTYVGVVNPSGVSETFCLSGVEFAARGIPVVTYKGYGLLDTVIPGVTGLTDKKGKKQAQYIVRLLKDKSENLDLGDGGKTYSREHFSPNVIIQDWVKLIDEICSNQKPKFLFSGRNMHDDWKWLKYLNYRIHKMFPFLPKLSVCYGVSWVKVHVKMVLKMGCNYSRYQ